MIIPITTEWTLIKHPKYWVLLHIVCNGYISAPINGNSKLNRCSGCDRKVDNSVLSKIPFLTQYTKVVNAWRGNNAETNSSNS